MEHVVYRDLHKCSSKKKKIQIGAIYMVSGNGRPHGALPTCCSACNRHACRLFQQINGYDRVLSSSTYELNIGLLGAQIRYVYVQKVQ